MTKTQPDILDQSESNGHSFRMLHTIHHFFNAPRNKINLPATLTSFSVDMN